MYQHLPSLLVFRDPQYRPMLRNRKLTTAVQVAARRRRLLSAHAATIRQRPPPCQLHHFRLLAHPTHHDMEVGAHHRLNQIRMALVVTAVGVLLAVTEAVAVVLAGTEAVAEVTVEAAVVTAAAVVAAAGTMVAMVGTTLKARAWVSSGIVLRRADPLGSSTGGAYGLDHRLLRALIF